MWSARAKIRRAQIYDLVKGEMTGPGLEAAGLLIGAELSSDGKNAATIASTATGNESIAREVPDGMAGRLQLWEWRTGQPRFDPVPMPSEPRHLSYSPDGKLIAVACGGGQILVVDTTNGRLGCAVTPGLQRRRTITCMPCASLGTVSVLSRGELTQRFESGMLPRGICAIPP